MSNELGTMSKIFSLVNLSDVEAMAFVLQYSITEMMANRTCLGLR